MAIKMLPSVTVKQQSTAKRLADILSLIYLVVLAMLPFHALVTTWAGSNFGHLDAWRIWKEVLIVGTVPAALYLVLLNGKLRYWARTSWLARLIGLYGVLYVFCGLIALWRGNVNGAALLYALLANLRFLGFFLLVAAAASVSGVLRKYAIKVIIAAAMAVVLFGILQLALPHDFLRHFGYGPNTIPAYQTVDNKIAYQRIQSTLRGANPLGAYLVLIVSLLGALWLKFWRYRRQLLLGGGVTVIALFFSYSRSAYVGAVLSLVVGAYVVATSQWRRSISYGLLVMLACGSLGLFVARDIPIVQNTLFHSDDSSTSSQSSNAGRALAMKQGLHDVAHQPLGLGPGTAGPESQRNRYPARIAENYFIQIAQEVGWLGIVLFVLINVMIGAELWYAKKTVLGLALFSSLIGLTFVNMVSHAWADDTLGLLWWGLAGVVVGSAIMNHTGQTANNGASTQKTSKRS